MSKSIVLLSGLLSMIVFAGIVNAEPSITVEPSSAHRSEYVTLSGTGWLPNQLVETIEPFFSHWKGVTGDDGNFSVQVQVPGAADDIPCGQYGLDFYSSPISPESERASTDFTILTGIIWTEPNSGPPGTMIKIYGNYFYDTGGRFVGLEGVWKYRNKSGTHDDMMFFTMGMDFGYDDETIFYIPSDVSPGWHRITVSGADRCFDSSWTDFYVTPYDDNIPPSTAVTLTGTEGKNDWYISDVDVTLIPTDNEGGSGVNKTEYSFDNSIWTTYDNPFKVTAERTTTVYYRSYDYAGNIESTKVQQINIDKNIPEIIIYAPEAEKDYLLNEVVIADWVAFDWYVDFDSEILSAQATVPNGETIDTSTVGSKTFSVETEDKAGRKKSVTIKYNVISPSVTPTPVPEYPAIALPLISLIGLVFILYRHRVNK